MKQKFIHITIAPFLLILILLISSCTEKKTPIGSPEYISEIEKWNQKRISNLKKENSWLNLVGLHWLKEGENTFGSDPSNMLVFPSEISPEFIGKIIKKDSVITTVILENVKVLHNGNEVKEIIMTPDTKENRTILSSGSLRWYLIKRGERYGIRIRDIEAEILKSFSGIERFPTDENFKISAKFIPYNPPKKVIVPTVIGTFEDAYSPGKIKFKINNKKYSLEPTSAGIKLSIVFADLTSGFETYGAGRFLYIDGPDSNNNVILDFNKSYNPPCVFTKYATCPLPREENKIRVRITAGEKIFDKSH